MNGALSDDEKDQLCKLSLKEVRAALAVQAIRPPSSDYGVRRLVSGMWQSFIRYGGSYLPVGTFASAEMAAHASDMCTYKLGGNSSGTLYNFPLEGFEKKKIEKLQWCQLIASLREEQEWSAHTTELADMEAASAVDEKHLSRDKRWILFVCQEQLIQQRMMRRASRVGQQIIVRRPELAEQFSPLNRRADGSPMLVEEVMECNSAPLLWTCQCGNLFLKSPASLAKIKPVCHQPGCTSVSRDRFSGSLN